MSENHLVEVKLVETPSPRLIIVPAEITLGSDTSPIYSLLWNFLGADSWVADGWIAGIRFELDDGSATPSYSGPFTNLCSTGSTVIACGNNGGPGSYRYRAVLEPPPGLGEKPIISGAAALDNEISEVRSGTIRVQPNPARPQELLVSPQDVSLVAGQCLLWEVLEAPADIPAWHPRLDFDGGPEGMNPYFGPFTSLDIRNTSILGSGGASGEPRKYSYRFQMISVEDGSLLFESSPDPTIDDEGDPGAEGPNTDASRRG